jgi:type IV secretion system protein TrbI
MMANTPPPPKVAPATIALRATQQPATRLNKWVPYGGAALGVVTLSALLWYALAPPKKAAQQTKNLLSTERGGPPPEAAATFDYSTLRQDVPQLGPPLPGDFGAAQLRQQRAANPPPAETRLQAPPPAEQRRTPDDTAARQRELQAQQQAAQELEKALSSGLFVKDSNTGRGAQAAQASAAARAAIPGRDEITQRLATVGAGRAGTEIGAGTGTAGLGAASGLGSGGLGGAGQGGDENMQGAKNAFMNSPVDSAINSRQKEQSPSSPFVVQAGAVIPAATLTGINSDLPGQIIAQVTQNVYDTPTGQYLLIPQGSRLLGRYDSRVSFGQQRVPTIWTRLVRPNGTSIVLENLPGTDDLGFSGVSDEVDNHWSRVFGAAILTTILDVGGTFASNQQSDTKSLATALTGSTSNTANQLGQQLTRRNLSIQPTLAIRPAYPLNVIVNKDMTLSPYVQTASMGGK